MSVAGSRRQLSVVALVAFSLAAGSVQAQTRSETLRYVTGASVNTLDPNIPGSTREAFAVSLSTYDRLVPFGRKQLNGKWVFDLGKITGELAETYEVSPDGLKLTFRLRKDAKFQDSTPVTAEDGQARAAQSRHRLSHYLQLEGRQGACDAGRSLGYRMAEGTYRRQRRL